MNSFLTVEDVNTAFANHKNYSWFEIDTAKISDTEDFQEVQYDFVTVSRVTSSEDILYSFQIDSDLWTKGYYVLDKNGNYINQNVYFYSSNTILFDATDTSLTSIRLFLYCGNEKYNSLTRFYIVGLTENMSLTLEEMHQPQEYRQYNLSSKEEITTLLYEITEGLNKITPSFLWINLLKSDFQFNCTQQLTIGKVNTVKLGSNLKYKPNGAMIGEYVPHISVVYNGETIPVTWKSSENDYCFNLDLSDKRNIGNIRFKVIVEGNKVVNSTETEVILTSTYQEVSSFAELKQICKKESTQIISVTDIDFAGSIQVTHPIKIIGDNTTFNMNNTSFILNERVEFIVENVWFYNGNPAIIQASNSKVTLDNCDFINCTSSAYNGMGSCILCDIDIENLSATNDFETNLIECNFTNNQSCILHSGQLTVDKCRYHNTNIDYANIHNVAFLHQTDGNAVITNSIFDIDYDTDDFCSDEINIGFAQCLVKCGETASINGANYIDLGADNTLPLFTQTIDNQAHLFAKYYYPQAETCVYSSPVQNYENKACCHTVSGVDWIFKNNVQITRVDWNSQNTKRTINWEE